MSAHIKTDLSDERMKAITELRDDLEAELNRRFNSKIEFLLLFSLPSEDYEKGKCYGTMATNLDATSTKRVLYQALGAAIELL